MIVRSTFHLTPVDPSSRRAAAATPVLFPRKYSLTGMERRRPDSNFDLKIQFTARPPSSHRLPPAQREGHPLPPSVAPGFATSTLASMFIRQQIPYSRDGPASARTLSLTPHDEIPDPHRRIRGHRQRSAGTNGSPLSPGLRARVAGRRTHHARVLFAPDTRRNGDHSAVAWRVSPLHLRERRAAFVPGRYFGTDLEDRATSPATRSSSSARPTATW